MASTSKIEDIIDFSECRQFIDTPVKRYSSGMYVKLAFSVAAHLESEILIMDEVLAVGDAKFQEKCLGRMGEEAHGGRTVLYVSHNMNTIRALCDRVIVLDHGKKVFDGNVEQGIELYNGLKTLSSGTVDLLSKKRVPAYLQHRYTLKSLKMSVETSQFEYGSHVKGTLCISSPEEKEDMGFFWMIRNMGGTPLVRMDTRKHLSLYPGDNEIPFEVDLSSLIPGKYFVTMAVVIKNSWDSVEIHDYLYDAYCFEILAGEASAKFSNWDPLWFGYQSGSDIIV